MHQLKIIYHKERERGFFVGLGYSDENPKSRVITKKRKKEGSISKTGKRVLRAENSFAKNG